MERLKTSLCGILLDNPVIAASGTFGYGYEFAKYYDINMLGTFSCKGTTAKERFAKKIQRRHTHTAADEQRVLSAFCRIKASAKTG